MVGLVRFLLGVSRILITFMSDSQCDFRVFVLVITTSQRLSSYFIIKHTFLGKRSSDHLPSSSPVAGVVFSELGSPPHTLLKE